MSRTNPSPARRALAAAWTLALLLPPALSSQALPGNAPVVQDGSTPVSPDKSFLSNKDVVLYPPDHGLSSFRFLPKGSYAPFDRSLDLSAAEGESRLYLLQVSSGQDDKGAPPIFAYVIDKKSPAAPRAEPGTGLYYGALEPRLSSPDGADVYWSLIGPQGPSPSFAHYEASSGPRILPPATGTATYTLLAYAVDAAGNRGYPARFVYRMAEPGLPAAAPVADSGTLVADASIPNPTVEEQRGYSELSMPLPPGASLLLDIDPDAPPSSAGDFERVDAEGGVAKLRFPCPYAWTGSLTVYFGVLKEGGAAYNPQPITIGLSNPADEVAAPPAPEGPTIAADQSGRASFAVFPSYDGELYVSIDGAAAQPYVAPVPLPLGKPSATISWYGLDDSGQRSPLRSGSFALPQPLPDIPLTGISDGAISGSDVTLRPSSKGELRYEVRLDGTIPPEPTSSSPLVGDALPITCAAGQELSVVLRYRCFAGDAAGEGRILRFTLDRKPPDAPKAIKLPSAYTDKPVSISLLPGQGAKDIYASVSTDGAESPFLPVTSPLSLEGSDSGPVRYVVRAYDVDAAGNRSQEMKSLSLVVDRSSVYVAEDGDEAGDGSPDRPFASFDAALAAALRSGKRNLNMRGSLAMLVPARITSEVGLTGGFDQRWSADTASRARLRVAVPAGQAAFTASGGSLGFHRIDVSVEASGQGPFISLDGAALAIDESSVSAGAAGDFVLVSAVGSKLTLEGSRVSAARGMSFTAFSADDSDISLEGSSVAAAKGVRIFGAFAMAGGSLSLRQTLLESHADLGLNLLSLRSLTLLVDRSLITADGGVGFLRLGSFDAVSGELRNSKVHLSWNGPGTLFELSNGGPSFKYDTIVADAGKSALRFFDSRGAPPQIWNSILEASGQGSELLHADTAPGAGVLVADCLWGFDSLLTGAATATDLHGLNALNAESTLYSSKPIISESPERSFATPLKTQASLRPDSECVNGGLPLGGGYEVDFAGRPRVRPDIGADALDG